jgi:hypothetical protein
MKPFDTNVGKITVVDAIKIVRLRNGHDSNNDTNAYTSDNWSARCTARLSPYSLNSFLKRYITIAIRARFALDKKKSALLPFLTMNNVVASQRRVGGTFE